MEPIAITGMACRVPGADDPDALWSLLVAGRHAIGEVPADRYGLDEWTEWRAGGFVERIFEFDAAAFGIDEAEARAMDPQQRLLLEAAHEAVEDAGLRVDRLRRTRTGVFVGIGPGDYARVALRPTATIAGFTGPANFISIAANRLSYVFDLKGPSLAIDTACTSSLTAIHLACRSIATGECSAAIAAGVNAILLPELTICAGRAGSLSRTGRVRAFDAAADGYVRGEGVAVVVLEPLARAVADGRPIHAVILASGVSHGGAANGLAAPNRRAQEELIAEVCKAAGIGPHDIQLVEAQGTGTALGDAMEAEALAAALTRGRATPLWIGSVKTNLGHLETAAGAAAVIKTALALGHATVPPSLGFERPNTYVDFAARRLEVVTTTRAWPEAPRRCAAVNAFAVGGTHAHVILEAAPERPPPGASSGPSQRELLILSARTESGLRALAGRWVGFLRRTSEPWRDVAWSAATTRRLLRHRLGLVAASVEEAAAALAAFAAGGEASGLISGVERRESARVALVFDSAPRIGADVLARSPRLRAALDEIAAVAAARGLEQVDPAGTGWANHVALAAELLQYGIVPQASLASPEACVAAAVVMGALDLDGALDVLVGAATAPAIEVPSAAGLAALAGRSIGLVVAPGSSNRPAGGHAAGVLAFSGEDEASLLASVASLVVAGATIDPALVFAEPGRHVRLPPTPWERRPYRW